MSSNTRTTPEKVGRIAAKVASEAAYVITGMADVVAGTVRDVVNQSRAGYSERKASGGSPVKDYAKQVPGQVKGMVGEVKEAYESLSARGRVVFKEGLAKTAHRDITPPVEQSTDYEQPPTSRWRQLGTVPNTRQSRCDGRSQGSILLVALVTIANWLGSSIGGDAIRPGGASSEPSPTRATCFD